jgi:iron complex transport system substrate-binding protein
VSLVPSVTEVIYALEAEAMLVGNTNQCDFPAAAKRVSKVGDFVQPDVERIVALGPTLVFAALPVHQRLLEKLAELRVRTYLSRPENLAAVMAEIDSIGALLGRRERAESLTGAMRARLRPPVKDTPAVFVEISSTPLMTAGSRTFINELIVRAGARNVFADALLEYPVIDAEAVAARNPDAILVLHPDAGAASVKERVGWQQIAAVRSGRVFDQLDQDLLFRPGPRVVEGVELLYRVLHERRTEAAGDSAGE